MLTRQRKQTPFRRLWMPLVTAAFLGYFGFHAFSGSYGIWAMDRLEKERTTLTMQLAFLRSQRESLDQQVASVRPDSLDAEIVDVEARTALNMMRADEIVIRFGAMQ